MDVYSLRLTEGTIVQIRGERYSLDRDHYPGATSRYRAAFRLIWGDSLPSNLPTCAVEISLWDEETGQLAYSFATTAATPAAALDVLDQFDPCAYLPQGHLQPHDLPEVRTRYDERAKRFREEALQLFG